MSSNDLLSRVIEHLQTANKKRTADELNIGINTLKRIANIPKRPYSPGYQIVRQLYDYFEGRA